MKARRSASGASAGDQLLLATAVRHWPVLAVTTAVSALQAVLLLALPTVLSAALDPATPLNTDGSAVAYVGATILLLVATEAVGQFVVPWSASVISTRLMTASVRNWLSQGGTARAAHPPGDVVTRIVGSTTEIGRTMPETARLLVGLLGALGGMTALGLHNAWVLLAVSVVLPASIAVTKLFVTDLTSLAQRHDAVKSDLVDRLLTAVHGSRTIRSCGTADREQERILYPLPSLHALGLQMWRAIGKASWQHALITPGVQVAAFAVAGFCVSTGTTSADNLFVVTPYVAMILGGVGQVGQLGRVARGRGAAQRLAEVLQAPPMAYGDRELPLAGGEVRMREVSLSLAGERVLDRVTFTIPAGTTVALVGPERSGKSALAAVVGRLLDPDEGAVLLDGVPLPELSRRSLRTAVSFAFERPQMLGETLRDALTSGPELVSEEQLRDATQAADAASFIARLPRGYDTLITDLRLSGGEWQRLGLARAIGRDSRVLVLDDATGSLDTVTEHRIQRAVQEAMAERTRIVVARRPAVAARADAVAWLDDGRLRGFAPHEQLWSIPAYRAVFHGGTDPHAMSSQETAP
ncbi:ATP-binding cassette domain-containing protein [Streptomyces sp. NPDC002521]